MINTAPPASNSVYGRGKIFKSCDAVVKEFLERADKPGSTPGDAVFCFFLPFFFSFCLVSFFKHYFSFGLFFFILNADPAGHALEHLDQYIL